MSEINKPAILGGQALRTTAFAPRKTLGAAEKQAVIEVMDSEILSDFIAAPGACFLGGQKVQAFE